MMSNNLLSLYKEFRTSKRPKNKFDPTFYSRQQYIDHDYVDRIITSLANIKKYFSEDNLLDGYVLFSVFNKKIMAKSNRLKWLFSFNGKSSNNCVVGSSFFGEQNEKQIITYSMSLNELDVAIRRLKLIGNIIEKCFNNYIDARVLKEILDEKEKYKRIFSEGEIKRTNFVETCGQLTYIEEIKINKKDISSEQPTLVTFFKIPAIQIKQIFNKLNINPIAIETFDDTYLLSKEDSETLTKYASYLIVEQTKDFSKFDFGEQQEGLFEDYEIPSPKNEPVIGVIDGPFAKNHPALFKDPYFSEWVECFSSFEDGKDADKDIDYKHGTEVDSLIVDLARLNPGLDDGCGRFRVRHFGIAKTGGVNTSFMMKKIREIVKDPRNSDIKVWNLCLGQRYGEIKKSQISLEGSLLDELQNENPNIVFVVSGTNKPDGIEREMMIGAPADSINSIVVNSCRDSGDPCSYSRSGPALSFFIKPDLSTIGGDFDEKLNVWSPWGMIQDFGTSLAAPLISRKLAFLMNIMKFNRNIAKALLIDSAVKWSKNSKADSRLIGRGIVDLNISEILKCKHDEIRFYVEGYSQLYSTYTYSLPVPVSDDNKYHYRTKATLCYFPKCTRSQGVDYTNTELTLKIGRLKKDGKIESIDSMDEYFDNGFMFEKEARSQFRKWDNIKVLNNFTTLKKSSGSIVKNTENKNWGISVTYQDRIDSYHKEIVPWGLVVTLKATDGINRYDDFIKSCELNGWLVTEVKYENILGLQVNLFNKIDLE